MRTSVELSLRSLLLQRIYPTNISLVRSDSGAAKLVHAYVAQIASQVESASGTPMMSLDQAREALFKVRPLVGLTEGTIRKYIAELWQEEHGIKTRFEIQTEKNDAYDERR